MRLVERLITDFLVDGAAEGAETERRIGRCSSPRGALPRGLPWEPYVFSSCSHSSTADDSPALNLRVSNVSEPSRFEPADERDFAKLAELLLVGRQLVAWHFGANPQVDAGPLEGRLPTLGLESRVIAPRRSRR